MHNSMIEISLVYVVIEVRGVENSDLVVSVNNTFVCHTSYIVSWLLTTYNHVS